MARGDCVNDLMNHYEISSEKVHMILVNRLKAGVETRLKDGDHVWLVPLAAGG
jgi:molybdopterin converting factor small subunit